MPSIKTAAGAIASSQTFVSAEECAARGGAASMETQAIHRDDTSAEVFNEVQLLLSELRTSLSLMRTGIAILALPLSVFSVLVATSRYYDALNVLGFLLPLAILCAVLMIFGSYLIIQSWRKVRRIERLIHRIKLEHSVIAEFMEPIA